ncbi:MAG TPA: UDP-N-acetylglucosamine 2-epimerase [Candidatus Dojkabacteria bacterium]|nr:UDP-N-acetylglucosamine 2-epimerase [Candidatus Dojkabacteria bacterium]
MIVTITGIRPDFIRMKKIFEKLDDNFDHIMIHTGQHYDDELSKIFFQELDIRRPDYVLESGKNSHTQYEQLSYLSIAIPNLLKEKRIKPDLILFLGDSNSAMVSAPLFKEGYRIGHIEGGMRSYDRRMPEEVNRVICDYVSDYIFVYTPLYKQRLLEENKSPDSIFVVGNTIREIVEEYMPSGEKSRDYIVADIHRNENLSSLEQYDHILQYINLVGEITGLPVKIVKFNRAFKLIGGEDYYKKYKNIDVVGPYGFLKYLDFQYRAYGVISDSGTSQEEGPLLEVPVAVPRLFTERPESVENGNSILVGETNHIYEMADKTVNFFKNYSINDGKKEWLGDGNTSEKIITILREKLEKK